MKNALDDPARLAALRRLNLLDSGPEAGFDRLTRLTAQVLEAPVCLISFVDDCRQFPKSVFGLGELAGAARQSSFPYSFCQHVVTSGEPLAVENAPAHPLVGDNLSVRDYGIRAYLGAPIRSPDGFVLGSLSVMSSKPRAWLPREKRLLREFAALVETEISLGAERNRSPQTLVSSSEGMIRQNAAGLVLDCNAAAARLLGVAREQLVGQSAFEAIGHWVRADGTILPREGHPLRAPFSPGAASEPVIAGLPRAGAVAWLELNVEWCGAPGDADRQRVTWLRDVTDRQMAEGAMRTSTLELERLKFALDQHAIVAVTDVRGIITYVNDKFCQISKYARDELLGRDHRIINSSHHPREFFKELWTKIAQGTVWKGEVKNRAKDGSIYWVDTTIVPFLGIDGKPINYVAIRADITERKAAEAELVQQSFALDQHAIVAITDVRGTITYVNDKFCQISKYPREELLGQNHKLINSGHHPRLFFWELYRAIAAGEVWHGEICNRAKDGSLYWVDTTIVPVLNDSGKPVSYVAIRADITTRKNLEESLARHRDQALEASRLKSEFLANMSHEIRTPMNGIIGMSGLLLDSLHDEKQREMGRVVIGSAENLLVIINDILDFSKIEAGKLRIQPEEFELRSALEETLALLAPRANEKGLELLCDFDERLDAVLLGDAGRIRQMLTNLVGNAIKFTEYGEVLVRVKWLQEEAEHLRFHVSVRDTGIGLSAATQARLFEPFFQADGGTTRNYGGTGLGLAITRQLVEHMGGRIGVNSVEGEGAEFWFELDLPRIASGSGVEMAPLPAGTRVLVVDDNATNRKILIGQITAMGGSVDSVGSGAAALARLQFAQQAGEPFSAAVLDWHMPAMDGLELAARIRAGTASAAIPLIMLSSSGPLVSPGEETKADFAAYLTKPVRKKALHRALLELSLGPVPAPKDSPAISVASAAGFRLLLAEDNSTNRQVAQLMLEKLGMAVDVAKNGREALELLARRPFDGVLMDCQMPVLDGYEATRRIRSGKLAGVNPQIPIIALTAHARPEDRTRCLEAGMSDYVTKPIRPTELKAALERCGIGPNQAGSAAPVLPAAAEAEGVFDEETLRSIQALPGINGPSLLLELARLYLSDEAERLAGLTQLANAHEGQLLAEAVHGFGGNAASFGGLEVRQVALDLEDGARAGNWEEVSVQLERLRKACQRLRAEAARRKLTAA